MPRYAFVARTKRGSSEKGTLEAPNPDEAISILQARELIVVSINENRSSNEGKPASLGISKGGFHGSLKQADLVVFARSLAAMTEAGMPLLRAMEIVGEQTRSKRMAGTIKEMVKDIRGGSTFRDAIAKHPSVFSPFWVGLIETGEASGQLTRALEQIATHLEKSGAVQRKVISALMYPMMLMVVAVMAILVFSLKIIPTFAELFGGFGAKLPGLTLAVIAFSNFFRQNLLLIVGGTIAAWMLIAFYIRTKPGRWQFDKLKLRAPVIGPVVQGVVAQDFASNLGTLLKAGVPILHALEIVITTCNNTVVASVLQHVRFAVREGRPLAEPLSHTDVFPIMVSQMIAVGEQTGKLSNMLEELARYYEEQVATAVERMTTLLEPIMLIGMGLVIGTLVVSMYMPIFQISQIVR